MSFADPYCAVGRESVLKATAGLRMSAQDGGTMVVVDGLRFSTRAESRWFASAGWSLVNMTGHPEAVLARELAMCYTCVALVTDYDAGVEAGEGVASDEVFQAFAENAERLKRIIRETVALLPTRHDCRCATALNGLTLPLP